MRDEVRMKVEGWGIASGGSFLFFVLSSGRLGLGSTCFLCFMLAAWDCCIQYCAPRSQGLALEIHHGGRLRIDLACLDGWIEDHGFAIVFVGPVTSSTSSSFLSS